MPVLHQPDMYQQEAITCTERGIRIVAPAGSGKTETIARRVAHRISQGLDPQRILVLTFDKAGQSAMSSYLKDTLGRNARQEVRTLNSHGLSILKEFFPEEIAGTVLGSRSGQWQKLEDLFDSHRSALPVLSWDGVERRLVDRWTSVFSAMKNEGLQHRNSKDGQRKVEWLRSMYLRLGDDSETMRMGAAIRDHRAGITADPYALQIQSIIDLYDRYDEECRTLDVMEYADQKLRAFRRIWNAPDALATLRSRYDEIIVDECQDLSRLDALLIYVTLSPDASLFLAGDDDQTMYEFRNAHSIFLRHPERYFENESFYSIELALNYRSPQEVLDPAARLISHNVERIDKRAHSGLRTSGEVSVVAAASRAEQGDAIVEAIQAELAQGTPLSDIAIIVDAGHKASIQRSLDNAQIPHVDSNETARKTDAVELVSFLKAKGRQWPMVIIPNLEDAELPDNETLRKGEIEAARRKLYVAMTRSSRRLLITYVRDGEIDLVERGASDEIIATNGASRFLHEAGLVTPTDIPTVTEPSHESSDAPIEAPPEPVVEPKVDDEPKVKPKRVKMQLWDLRANEKTRLEKSRTLLKAEEYEFACESVWKPVESVIVRLYGATRGGTNLTVYEAFRIAEQQGNISPAWCNRFHEWRKLRNEMTHTSRDVFDGHDGNRAMCTEMVMLAPSFLEHLADGFAPQQLAFQTDDEYVERMLTVTERISNGKPIANDAAPTRQMPFDPQLEQYDVLMMQLGMILRDARFYIPDAFRWSSAPLMSRFLVETIGWVPQGVRANGRNRCSGGSADEERVVLQRMGRVLERIAGDNDPAAFLQDRVSQALTILNGEYHSGFKFLPSE